MGIFDALLKRTVDYNFLSPEANLAVSKKGSKEQFGLINTDLNANLNVATDLKADIQSNTDNTRSSVVNQTKKSYNYSPIDNSSVALIFNSPNAGVRQSSSASSYPDFGNLTSNPDLSGASRGSDVPLDFNLPVTAELGLGNSSGLGAVVLIGALGLTGVYLFTSKKKN